MRDFAPRAATIISTALDSSTFACCAASFGHTPGGREGGGRSAPSQIFAGRLDPETGESAPDSRALFDLASLTKPLATALLALKAADRREIDLDREAQAYLPPSRALGLGPSILQILAHCSGLPAIPALEKLFPEPGMADRERAIRFLLDTAPSARPGERIEYSCTGYLILGLILEKVGGARLGELFRSEIAAPLGLEGRALFCPTPSRRAESVPTEFCLWRGRRIRGEVHDESSWCMGGDGGNAGLFADLEAVEQLFSVYLDGGGLIREELAIMARSCQIQMNGQRRGLGFLISQPAPGWGSETYGHTGFVGNSIWRDPATGLTTIILSNRVYFGRDESLPKIQAFRERFHRAAAEDLS
ncbi:MAG TPA: serine hydrolase domain-containing protein [Rectinemataceae bacterium]